MSEHGAKYAAAAIIIGGLLMAFSLMGLAFRVYHVEQGLDPNAGPRAKLIRDQDQIKAMLEALLAQQGIPTPIPGG